ncbi:MULTISPECIES: twin-arginine translocase TatA/TatE family subunit [Sphingomonas]|jgi:sec-independent protein translocase protein TatA|uniref:Sec-independent protein translocase protein TatA n=2 Tax=Pseudomonadota TaxID=1224 RepID=A0A7X5ZWJ4_9SPHN|nr:MULTISPECIES: twin-arginine translocase TatA/TatE family subunit [Sphingomonas]MDF2386177.1 twin-arginine translocase TatA/TatE family subunit [Nostoc ellipsosporum NOK]MBN8810997.1 twin-arginine translocase TatA/TatE family subunit [Sphingomonas sp.]NIJ66300.1 sec-independent protein translocase protein TatA [Sphingomonas leidyi]OJY54497.1 MAG: Sec-independent protein translocase TatA [Sphingomonas sp. 67-41]OSZ65150.1 Sec-independent protein translocase TatA [Sphingomonas sp. IBVSS2]
MGMGSIWHWLVLGLIAILLLGGGRFSNMMGDVAKGIKQFKKGMSEDEEDKPATRIEGKAAPEPTVQREAEAAREEKL